MRNGARLSLLRNRSRLMDHAVTPYAASMSADASPPPVPSTHEAWWPSDLFAQGIGWVIVARFKSGGRRVEAGIFLVDVLCLGVKLAVYEDTDADDYHRRIRDHYTSDFPIVSADPCCARKLIEQAVAYAGGLGFGSHPDLKQASRVFGGLKTDLCQQQFAFGSDGKPFYRRGPRESEGHALRIVQHLGRRLGEGNFDYLVLLGDEGEAGGAEGR